jgi:hypothetical protein
MVACVAPSLPRVERVLYRGPPTYAYEEWIEDTIESIYSALDAQVICGNDFGVLENTLLLKHLHY